MLPGVEHLSWDKSQYDMALNVLRNEFAPKEDFENYLKNNINFTLYNLQDCLKGNTDKEKGSDIFTVRNEDGLIGVSQVKYYSWKLLQPQLYFSPSYRERNLVSIKLRSIGELVSSRFGGEDFNISAELAYFWVREDMRKKGIGKRLFFYPLDRFSSMCGEQKKLLFTTAMGVSAGKDIGKQLLGRLLAEEEKVNGCGSDGKVVVTGVEVDYSILYKDIGLDSSQFKVRDESLATVVLSNDYGMEFLGYSKNLSPTYGVVK